MIDDHSVNDGVDNHAVNQARAMVYRLLSSLFAKEVEQAEWQALTTDKAAAFWQYLASEPDFNRDIQAIWNKLKTLTTDSLRLELAADYCGLFLVAGKGSVSPYLGSDLDKDIQNDTVFGPMHQKMVSFLNGQKLQVKSDFPEPADHIAVVLAYMEYIADEKESEQLAFLESYLKNWVELFADKVAEQDPGGFYKSLASFTRDWINSDIAWLQEGKL